MSNVLTKRKWTFEYFLIFFILLQPVIDLLTSFSIFVLEVDLTFGVFIRFGVMALILLYILRSGNPFRKQMFSFLLLFGAVIFIGFLNNFFIKDSFSLFSEIKNIAKIIYFPIVLMGYITAFNHIRGDESLKKKIHQNIFISMLIISVVMIVAPLTNTEILSYDSNKLGQQGWFFAGNELGAIMAISFGVVIFYSIIKSTNTNKLYLWIPVALMAYSMMQLGTKVGFGASALILVIAFIMMIFDLWKKRKTGSNNKILKTNILINFILLVLFALYTPFSPVAVNMNIHIDWVDLYEPPAGEPLPDQEETERKRKAVENIVFSGREDFLALYKADYSEAPIMQKLFGMGYGGNDTNDGHPIEMDFHDLFFALGMIGFIVYFLPIIYLAYRIIAGILRNVKNQFNLESALFGASIILGFGVAYTAGHVLTAPAVSIYLAVLIAYLYQKVCLDKS